MTVDDLIEQGNQHRAQNQPAQALACYAQAFVEDFNSAAAWNNYGNVIREMGYPDRAIPFLEQAIRIDADHTTARFNLAVALLLKGDYAQGWPAYESRWNFEHLAGTLPAYHQPRWQGEDLRDRTILIIGEQGLGDCIQFVRYVEPLQALGARIILQVPTTLISLLQIPGGETIGFDQPVPDFDVWCPMMSLPVVMKHDLTTIPRPLAYIQAAEPAIRQWQDRLGPKKRLRVGVSWSGRRDTWINQHKSVPFELIADMIRRNPRYQWINLQVDADEQQSQILAELGATTYPGTIQCMADTAALIACLDVVISVDSAVSHLSAAQGRPTWIMLNDYAVDWRWLRDRGDSPWYPTVKLFRQPGQGDWDPVLDRIQRFLPTFTI
jgi:tetratricopeptide (TPR) repeat protein